MVGTILFKAVFDLASVINLCINHRINLFVTYMRNLNKNKKLRLLFCIVFDLY